MPRAETLEQAFNNLYSEPLKERREFEEFYVKRPPGRASPMEELKKMIEISAKKGKCLFLGFRGSGKSTELNRLKASLDEIRFIVVSYSITDGLDMSDFDFRDFFVVMALKIYDTARSNGMEFNEDIEADFQDFIKKITRFSEEDRTSLASAGLSWPQLIMLRISREVKTREYVRRELEMKISDLIQKLNWLIVDVESKMKRKLVVMVDDLDKMTRGKQSEDFFYRNYGLLLQPDCHVIYTFPIHLAFHPFFENVRAYFDDDVVMLQLPSRRRDGSINHETMGFYSDVITRRVDPDLLEDGVLEKAIISTGKMTELLTAMRIASLNALRVERRLISMEDLEYALGRLRKTYDRTLTEAHKRKLLEIQENKWARDEGPDSVIIRELLFSLTAVEYEDEAGRWCEINPLLKPLAEEWSKSQ